MFSTVRDGFVVHGFVGGSSKSGHSSTLRLRHGRGWSAMFVSYSHVCVSLPSFCLVLTPPMIAKTLGNDFSIREIQQAIASAMF